MSFDRVDFKTGVFYQGDCFEVLETLPAGSVDMILNDPPYGTTACAWDSILPLPDMWAAYWRVLKANGPAVLTAAQPFTSALVMSAPDVFRYLWLWDKISVTGFANAKKKNNRCGTSKMLRFSIGPCPPITLKGCRHSTKFGKIAPPTVALRSKASIFLTGAGLCGRLGLSGNRSLRIGPGNFYRSGGNEVSTPRKNPSPSLNT